MSDDKKQWAGPFTREEFLERAEEHERIAERGLRAGPNISYVRTFQACATALRIAADHLPSTRDREASNG